MEALYVESSLGLNKFWFLNQVTRTVEAIQGSGDGS